MTETTSDKYAQFRNTRYFASLDGIRFVCILMVVWHHGMPRSDYGFRLANQGYLGVDFFFVLSGFLITTLLLREADQYGRFSIRKFIVRRTLRILPAYYFVVTIVGLYYLLVKNSEIGHLLPYYYFFMANFLTEQISTLHIFWSLSVEEQFYLLWPATLLLVPRKWLPYLLVLLLVLNAMLGIGWITGPSLQIGPLLLQITDAPYAPILTGALLALIANTKRGHAALYRALGARWTSGALVVVFVAVLSLTPSTNIEGWNNPIIHLSMTALIAALVLRPNTLVSKCFEIPFIRRIGTVSYGIYLYHLIGLDLTSRVFAKLGVQNEWLLLVAYSMVSYVMAEISFRTLETYFRKFRPKS